MKYIITITTVIMLTACNQQNDKTQQLQAQIDSLKIKLDNTYKPGFGEFMSGIQVHHAKLWFAGTNENWKLADFEIHEIQESLEDIQKFNTDRPEGKSISMLNPPMDSVMSAIKLQNQQLFKNSFILLTKTCNNCHKKTEHEFNVITIPTTPPINNQSFKVVK